MNVERLPGTTIVRDSPIGDAIETSPFGKRPSFTAAGFTSLDFHFGSDLISAVADQPTLGTIIKALRPGVALTRDDDPRDAGGLVVRLDHGAYQTEYFHTLRNGFRPSTGSAVTEMLGFAQVGDTGLVTGPHLHLVLKKAGGRFEYTGFDPAHVYITNHIDPLSEEGLAFFNNAPYFTAAELVVFASKAIGRGAYTFQQRSDGLWLVVETKVR